MRDILFRGKCFHTEEWVEGYLGIEVPDELVIQQFSYDKYFESDCIDQYSVKPETVGQYTGLTDKNGTKIFEGDILSAYLDDGYPENETLLEVVWHNNGWYGKNGKFFDDFENGFEKYFEVIGNVHDNLELLQD